ncbi:MAG: Cof-type HAD-IIB family hydrolase [Oscillospiraceae bacterium]|nr:Cof-type HAD-IIB family hydrolase [Oscillospiraceae bacterium]
MSVSLIAVDVDGTLIDSCGRITRETQAAVAAADRAGIQVALSTGRARDECSPILRELPQIRYTINCSGASVYDVGREQELFTEGMPMETVRALYRRLSPLNCLFEVMADGHIFTDRLKLKDLSSYHNPYYIDIIRRTRTPVELESLLAARTSPVAKIHLFFRSAEDQQLARSLTEDFGLVVLSSVPENLEINTPSASKGAGLRVLAAYLRIPLADTMAIGDNLNDVSMLREAEYPVVVGNAHPDTVPYARYITASCDEDGVASAIRHVLAGTLGALKKE